MTPVDRKPTFFPASPPLTTRAIASARNLHSPSAPRRRGKTALGVALLAVAAVAAFAAGALATATLAPPTSKPGASVAPSAPPSAAVLLDANPDLPVEAASESENLSRFLHSFDHDGDGRLALSEAAAFYSWVEHNIDYRWDDEGVADAQDWTVGDGRSGDDYQQTPDETYAERMGDCEDQNGLELAFYQHWGVPAYLAYVNARSDEAFDHAITLVFGAPTLGGFRARLGDAPYYEALSRSGVQDGFYFIVDNAYSNTFAKVSGGIEEGKFVVDHVASYADLFGPKWGPVLPSPEDPLAASLRPTPVD